jgi:hypothetical protein
MIAILFTGKGKIVWNILKESPPLIALVILAICIVVYLGWRLFRGGVSKEPLACIEKEVVDSSGLGKGERIDDKSQNLSFDEKLRRLHALYQEGILTEEEYQQEKRKLLDREK